MIVDLDARFWNDPDELGAELAVAIRRAGAGRWVQPETGVDALAFASRAVDATVLVGFESGLLRGSVGEDRLRRIAAASRGRVFLARAVDPLSSSAPSRVESARGDGFAAIWLDPALQGFNPSDTRAMRVFDRAEACQLPVLVGWSGPQASSARLEYARPFLLDEVARAFPRLSLVLSGLGAPFIGEALALLGKHDRVFATTAGIASRPWDLMSAIQSARDWGVDSRLLFASGFPFDTPARAIEAIYGLNTMLANSSLPQIPRSVLRGIVERDAISLLGLGVPPPEADRLTPRALAAESALGLPGDAGA